MKTIQPFIDLGFYTVPLKGRLERLIDGKPGEKSTPQYPGNWKSKYQAEFNEEAAKLGGVITGAISNIIAIDCDSAVTYELFKAHDPENKFHFISKGKPKGGGTIIYKYPHLTDGSAPLSSFSIQDELLNLDFYSDNGFVYLPSDENTTKEQWSEEELTQLPKLHDLPPVVNVLLHTLYKQYLLTKNSSGKELPSTDRPLQKANYLAPQIELMLSKGEFMPSVFRIITPKDLRSIEQYVRHGYLHPKNVPDGRGSEYLSKVSAILGADSSISAELYIKAIKFINDLWDEPIKHDRLIQTITDPMVEGKASVNGTVIWQYDEHWKTRGLTFTTKFGESAEVFFDDVRAIYYLINHTSGLVKSYQKDCDVYSYMDTVGVAVPLRKEFKPLLPLVRTKMDPSIPFGFYSKDEYTREFNMFQQTPALRILNDPTPYAGLYKRPENMLNFFSSLVPDSIMRHFLLRFLKCKLTTFNYSPVVLYFLGTHGSGKDTFVTILGNILGHQYIGKPATKEFLEQFNGWIIDTYFTQLDEYGNQLSRISDKQEALGKIKAYSGKRNIQIRQMRTDGFSYDHNTTFIMTANSQPLLIEDGDRRLAFFDTPNVLKDEAWVVQAGGITTVQSLLLDEIKDFCYYLATEVDDINPDDYVAPPVTQHKHTVIASKLPAAQRIAYCFKNHLLDMLYETCKEWETFKIFSTAAEGRVYEEDLFDLYMLITEEKGVRRGLSAAMKDSGYDKIPTTKEGEKAYYFQINELKYYSLPDSGFSDLEETEVEIDL
jgi:hypothetical protein